MKGDVEIADFDFWLWIGRYIVLNNSWMEKNNFKNIFNIINWNMV